jgi:hypothetical protein
VSEPSSDAVGRLQKFLEEEAASSGIAVTLTRSKLHGFGLTDAALLGVRIQGGQEPMQLWHERGNDFWLELGDDLLTAAWWGGGDDLRLLAGCVRALLVGDYEVRRGRVVVRPNTEDPITLAERL